MTEQSLTPVTATDLAPVTVANEPVYYLGGIVLPSHNNVIEYAAQVADQLKGVIVDRGLVLNVKGKEYVTVEGWETCAALLMCGLREVSCELTDDGQGYIATVEVTRLTDGMVVSRGSALCHRDEKRWGNADEYAVRSMAVTRAIGKACRVSFSWIVKLAGYEATPAEEMMSEKIQGQAERVQPVRQAAPRRAPTARTPARDDDPIPADYTPVPEEDFELAPQRPEKPAAKPSRGGGGKQRSAFTKVKSQSMGGYGSDAQIGRACAVVNQAFGRGMSDAQIEKVLVAAGVVNSETGEADLRYWPDRDTYDRLLDNKRGVFNKFGAEEDMQSTNQRIPAADDFDDDIPFN